MRGYLHCTPGNTGSVTFAYVNVAADTTYELDLSGLNTDGTKMDVSSRVESVTLPGPLQHGRRRGGGRCVCVSGWWR